MNESSWSHPESPVRHSYPLAVDQAGFGTALSLVMRTLPYALIYYCQNSMEILKTAAWVVVLDKVVTVVVWAVMLIPTGLLLVVLPTALKPGGMLLGFVIAALFASNIRQAFLKPIFLTMVMTKFHVVVRGQPINTVWDERLSGVSSKFRDLKDKALAPPPLPAH
jgi:hypothetical protein